MLGNAITDFFLKNNSYDVTTTYREDIVKFSGNSFKFDLINDNINNLPHDFDYVINCIGLIKPFMKNNTLHAIKINAEFPWILANWCNENNMKLIHVTTDCVFSGKEGKYMESDVHDALDTYGKSKSLGECSSEAMVIRTSIVGEEIHKNVSLISWAKSQKGKKVDGYATHLWNGITTKEFAKVCDKIIRNDWYEKGLFHVFAKDDVTKYQMLQYFNEKFRLELIINEKYSVKVDRTLRTEKWLCDKLDIPTVFEMINEM